MAVSMSPVAPVRALELPTPKGLFWFARRNCWSSKIGYHISDQDVRVRSQQYYPAPYTPQGLKFADRQFRAKQVEWDQIVEETRRRNEGRGGNYEGGIEKPVWPRKGALKPATLHPSQSKVVGVGKPDPTIQEAMEARKQALLHRTTLVGEKRIKAGTYNAMIQTLRLATTPHKDYPKDEETGTAPVPIDMGLRLSQITKSVLNGYHSYWHSAALDLSRRTRKNYCLAFWRFLCALAKDDAYDFTLPKGADDLFRFGGDTANIAEYDKEQLKLHKAKSPARTWAYCLLGLNCGQYPEDIANIQVGTTVIQLDPNADQKKPKSGEIVKLVDGKAVPLTRKELKMYDGSYDLYIRRIRNRTAHKYPYPALHWLWPETAMAVAKHVADDNEWDFALLNKRGLPLLLKRVGMSPQMPLQKSYMKVIVKVKKAGGKPLSFKQFRKLGVSAMGSIGDDTTVRLYRSQPPLGDAAMYQLDDYEKKLSPHLRKWREKLIADGVL